MSHAAKQLLAAISSLSPEERHDLLVMMLRESGEIPCTVVSDHQLVAIAEERFLTLDAEESNGDSQNAATIQYTP
jgi:hypothetical protein